MQPPHPVVEITSVAHGGHGVCRIDGQVCFVPYALPGDKAAVRIVRRTKGVLWGEIEEVVEASPDRCEVACPYFGRCGGCTWLHFAYPAQGEWKRRIVQDCLQRLGGITADVGWVEEPGLRTAYRTRAELHSATGRLGFYARGSHDVVHIGACPLCHPHLNAALEPLHAARPRASVELTVNPEGAEVFVHQPEVRHGAVESRVAAAFPEGTGARRFMFDSAPIVNGAFAQSSLLLNRMLRQVVRDLCGDTSSLLDLYCGNGNFSLGTAASVLGLDHNEAAILAAQEAALASGATAKYQVANDTAFRSALAGTWDTIILDPPRTGARDVMPGLLAAQARQIIYVSCDPATLARDLRTLVAGPWRITNALAVDMFPHTAHVETVCRLERLSQ